MLSPSPTDYPGLQARYQVCEVLRQLGSQVSNLLYNFLTLAGKHPASSLFKGETHKSNTSIDIPLIINSRIHQLDDEAFMKAKVRNINEDFSCDCINKARYVSSYQAI